MQYQRRSRKDLTEEQKQAYDEAMKDEGVCGREVLAFHKDNPPEMKKKGLVDFARFERIRGTRTSAKDSLGDIPMTERAFYKYCENKLGLTEEEMTEWWKELYADATVKRDNKGFRGAEQLWINAHVMKLREKENYVDARSVEFSGDIRAPTLEQREMLGRHVARQDDGFQDEHFQLTAHQLDDLKQGPQPAQTTPKKKKTGQEEDEVTPEKVINLTRERPNLSAIIEKGVRKLETDLKKSFAHAVDLMPKYADHPDDLKASDRILITFCRTAQQRQELVARILGQPADICQLVPDGHAAGAAAAPGTPASEVTVTGDAMKAVVEQELAKKKAMSFEVFLEQESVRAQKFWQGELSSVVSIQSLRELIDAVMAAQTSETFLQLKHQWEQSNKALTEISKGLKIATDDVYKHLKAKLSEQARDKKRKADAAAKQQLAKVKAEAKAAADSIKKRKTDAHGQGVSKPLFKSNLPPEVQDVAELSTPASVADMDFNAPWLLKDSGHMQKALQHSAVQKSLAIWGAQYKKAMSQHKLNVVTYPIPDGQGREILFDAWNNFIPSGQHVDVSSVAGGAEFEKAVWLFGVSSDLQAVSVTPNHAALFKTLACGEIHHWLVERASLVAALKTIGKEDNDFTASLQGCNSDDLASLVQAGAKMRKCVLTKESLLYVPCGWIQVETVTNHSLVYGARKSWFHKCGKDAYAATVEALKKGGTASTARMEAILALH